MAMEKNNLSLCPAFCGGRRTWRAAVLPPFLGKEMIFYSRNAAASEDIVNRYHAPNLFREVFCADFTVTVHCIDDDAHMHNGRQYGSVVTQKTL